MSQMAKLGPFEILGEIRQFWKNKSLSVNIMQREGL